MFENYRLKKLMTNIKKVLIIMFLAFATIIGFFVDSNYGMSSLLMEKIKNENPEAKVTAYIQAVSDGDKEKALDFWNISESYKLSPEYCNKIKDHGERITRELIEKKIKADFTITRIEWWSTCCVPNIIENSRFAGKAKVYIQLTDSANIKSTYIFEVIVPRGYAGGLAGHSVRHWVISDVYPEDEKPIF